MKTGTLVKLGFLKKPLHGPDEAKVHAGEVFEGDIFDAPEVGYSFNIGTYKGCLKTSTVAAVYKVGTNQDKLYVPKDFPDFENIELPEAKEGDIFFATRNSIYHLKDIKG